MGERSRNLGKWLAEAGASLEASQRTTTRTLRQLGAILKDIPLSFHASSDMLWRETPSRISQGVCTVDSDPQGATARSRLNAIVTITRESRHSSNVSDEKKGRAFQAPLSRSKSEKPGTKLRAPKQQKKEKISSDDVSALYKSLESKPASSAKKPITKMPTIRLKARSNRNRCDTTSTECESSSSDSSSTSCEEECVNACIRVPNFRLPNLRPTAIAFQFTVSPLSTTLRMCNSVLVHRLDRCLLEKIERRLVRAGVRSGTLSRIPKFLAPVHVAYFGGFPNSNLSALVDFKCGTITLGQSTLPTAQQFPRKLYGPADRPESRHPVLTLFGLRPGQFLTSTVTFGFIVDLQERDRSGELGRKNSSSGRRSRSDEMDAAAAAGWIQEDDNNDENENENDLQAEDLASGRSRNCCN